MRRSHDALEASTLSVEKTTGEIPPASPRIARRRIPWS
ncbi:hypothetical protein DND90_24560 [Pseudomonas syringae pv. maculicola]|nr:hypothetical protein DND90_24560 [Pseudomonas syringae pv. maculicola]